MKKIILVHLLSFTFLIASSQLTLKVNDKLVYDVDANGSQYNFAVKIKSLKPGFDFAWQMNNENGSYGDIKVSPAAMLSSFKMHNYFRSESLVLSNATSVVLSKAAFAAIQQKKKVTLYDGSKKFAFANADNTKFTYTVAGEERTVDAIYLSDENKNDIVVLKNPEYPLILRMNIGWRISLGSIVPAATAVTDLSKFIGKKITESGLLWSKLDKTSLVTIEDLTDVGIKKGPSVYKEYFSHIESLWVKAHNDTVTDIIYYPLPLSHSYHTYYGGDIKIPQLSSYSFTRAQAKNFVKTAFVSKTSYDTDVYKAAPGYTMELYYHVPARTKNIPEFGMSGSDDLARQRLGFITFQKAE